MKAAAMNIASDIYNLIHCFVDHNGCMMFFPQWKTSFIGQLCKCSDSDLGQSVTYYNQVPPLVSLFQSKLGNVILCCTLLWNRFKNTKQNQKRQHDLGCTLIRFSSSGLTVGMINFAPFWSPHQHFVTSCWNDLTLYAKDYSLNAE